MANALIDLGISSATDFFCKVARPNHAAFRRQPSTITALNAAWAYWHVHEWHFWDPRKSTLTEKETERPLKDYKAQMVRDCPELRWLRDMTNAWKHKVLQRRTADVRVRAISSHTSGPGLGTAALGTRPLGASMTRIVVDADGATHDLGAVLETVPAYWCRQLRIE